MRFNKETITCNLCILWKLSRSGWWHREKRWEDAALETKCVELLPNGSGNVLAKRRCAIGWVEVRVVEVEWAEEVDSGIE